MKPNKLAGQRPGVRVGSDTLGYTFVFSVLMFAGAGYLLDRWLGWIPVLTIIGTLTGAGLAFVWVYAKVRQDQADAHAKPPKQDEGDE